MMSVARNHKLLMTRSCAWRGNISIEIVDVCSKPQPKLFHIAGARNSLSRFPRSPQSRQKHARQNRDYRNYNEQFDKGKSKIQPCFFTTLRHDKPLVSFL